MAEKLSEIYSEEEIQEMEEGIKVLPYFMYSIFVFLFILSFFNEESDSYKEGQYLSIQLMEYNGMVVKKESHLNSNLPNILFLRNGMQVNIDDSLFLKIAKGDSVLKKKGCDSVFFFTKLNGILTKDLNRFYRENYLEIQGKKKKKHI